MLTDKKLKELLEDPMISEIAPDAISKWDLSKEEFYDWTLREIAEKMGWKNLKRGFGKLFEVASKGQYLYRLYSKDECVGEPQKENTNLVYFPSDDPSADKRPFIFLVPGGGFVNVWNLTEGWPIAEMYNELGYHVVILTYQICIEGAAIRDMDDIARAFKIIEEKKDVFHVDPGKYITCGFSAGGYIVCLWNTEMGYSKYGIAKPLASFPIYPVTSFKVTAADDWGENEGEKEEIAKNTAGCSLEEACNSVFEIPDHAEGFPPTALFAAAEDDLVSPENSKRLARALEDLGIPCRLEIGPTGGHGFADGEGMCMEGWPERAIRWYESL